MTATRDAVGYGFYFAVYDASRRFCRGTETFGDEGWAVLVSGGMAGVATWASVYPVDVVKTRVQTQSGLFDCAVRSRGAWEVAGEAWAREGMAVFFRGVGVCCVRAFVVNAAQWGVYEWCFGLLGEAIV